MEGFELIFSKGVFGSSKATFEGSGFLGYFFWPFICFARVVFFELRNPNNKKAIYTTGLAASFHLMLAL